MAAWLMLWKITLVKSKYAFHLLKKQKGLVEFYYMSDGKHEFSYKWVVFQFNVVTKMKDCHKSLLHECKLSHLDRISLFVR